MTRRATATKADIRRVVEGAIEGGWPVGSFELVVENGRVRLLPVAANAPSDDAADAERRMREAFGE